MEWIWLVLLIEIVGVGVLLYFFNKTQKRRSQIYSIVRESDSEVIPMQNIMSALQMDFAAISKDINAMSINGNYPLLRNSHIDIGKQILVISKDRLEKQRRKTSKINKKHSATDLTVIECKHCGAKNKKGSSSECEYCGSPL